MIVMGFNKRSSKPGLASLYLALLVAAAGQLMGAHNLKEKLLSHAGGARERSENVLGLDNDLKQLALDNWEFQIDAFDMELCGRADFRPWQMEQSAFNCLSGYSHKLSAQNEQRPTNIGPRILGGDLALENEFPSYARMEWASKSLKSNITTRSLSCGATLIHPNLVVTAAHCVEDLNWRKEDWSRQHPESLGNMELRFGSNWQNETEGLTSAMDRWCYPKDCSPGNDLAIVRLKDSVKYTSKIWPACIDLTSRPNNQTICAFAGSDNTNVSDPNSPSNQLNTLRVRRSCREAHDTESCYMAIEQNQLHVTMRGDSGSPVYCYDKCGSGSNERVRSYAVGANSWGSTDPLTGDPLAENHVSDFKKLLGMFLQLLLAIRSDKFVTDSVVCEGPL